MPFRMFPQTDLNTTNLDWLVEELHKLAVKVANITDDGKRYTDQQIKLLRQELQQHISDFTVIVKQLQATDKELQTSIDAVLPAAEKYIDAASAANLAEMEEQLRRAVEQLQIYIDDAARSVQVINYFTGEKVSIQSMFDYLSALHVATTAISYTQLSGCNCSYQQLHEKNHTYEWMAKYGIQLNPCSEEMEGDVLNEKN